MPSCKSLVYKYLKKAEFQLLSNIPAVVFGNDSNYMQQNRKNEL